MKYTIKTYIIVENRYSRNINKYIMVLKTKIYKINKIN